MPRNDEEEIVPGASSSTRVQARSDPFLVACRYFSLLTCLVAILCITVNILSAVRSFNNGYYVLGCWAGRGMLQIFVAVMTRVFHDYLGERKDLVLQNISCYSLLAWGVVYLVSGILCIGFLKRTHQQQQEITREQAIKDLEEELQQRKKELEQLLLPKSV